MKDKLNIWWKLAVASAVLDIVTIPVWIYLGLGRFPESCPIWPTVPLCGMLSLPVIYLVVFALWHWRTRYAGKCHLAWPILFGITALPLLHTLPCVVLTALVYFFLHLVPDMRSKGAYALPPTFVVVPPASPLPNNNQIAKSACFIVGWLLVIGGVFAGAITCIAHWVIWNRFEDILPGEVGKQMTDGIAKSLYLASQIGKITVITCLLSVLAAAVGAVLIQVSQRMRWRLLDEQEKEEIRKSI